MHGGAASSKEALYLYCFARAAPVPTDLEGPAVDGSDSLFLYAHREIVAVLSRVPLEEYVGEAAAKRMEDLEWVAPRALRHEQVIEKVAQYSPVLPARFGTLFSSSESLAGMLARHHDTIFGFLERMSGREEWGVKAYLDRGKARDSLVRERLASPADSSSAGTRFLQERRAHNEAQAAVGSWLRGTLASIRERLMKLAIDYAERRVLADTSDTPGEMVVNWAFLVPTRVVNQFRAFLEEFNREQRERGLELRASGPWPPASFTPRLAEQSE